MQERKANHIETLLFRGALSWAIFASPLQIASPLPGRG